MTIRPSLAVLAGLVLTAVSAFAIGQPVYVESTLSPGGFPLARGKTAATIYVDVKDYAGVQRVAKDLASDISRVTGLLPPITHESNARAANLVIVGTIGKSELIDDLVRGRKLDVKAVVGKWESFLVQVVARPLPGVANALVIAGSDKRGTIYGAYDLSEQIGVSPWHWWADVPVRHRDELYVKAGRSVEGPPAIKYRGIFLNDEAPALSGMVKEKFGGYNHAFYEKVFELILRMKGNYLWPAMWGSAFNEDDVENPRIADEWGIVMGTTHHEPMLRAQQEWKRHGTGPWDYTKNADLLRAFWAEGVRRNKAFESIISVGMRGDGDMPMARGEANVALLERIVKDQRSILAEQVNADVTKIPQLWALYKEVQEYYEKGMRVPDDVTLLWSDDNWGNIRRLPTPEERKRAGGAGVYYHFDYVGGPRNYKWINTNPIPKVWEQMTLAWQYGADRIWIVNVGDLKPMEFPTEFFLHLAWNPQRWPREKISEYTRLWAAREFGQAHASEIAGLVSETLKYNGRRKPELLEPTTYSLVNYQEADRVLADFDAVVKKAEKISNALPLEMRDAFFQLVLHPAKANAQVTELYVSVGKNRLYASQGRASTNAFAARAKALFQADADLSAYYNHTLAGGKWNHMMDQTHIGYTYWQEPRSNIMPAVKEIELPPAADPAVSAEGSEPLQLRFDVFNRPRRYIDVFNRGQAPFDFSASASEPWIVISDTKGTVKIEQRLWISIDWNKAPKGSMPAFVAITPAGSEPIKVKIECFNPAEPTRASLKGFVQTDGYVAIEAEHYTNKSDAAGARWERIEDYGRTLSAMTIVPPTAASVTPPAAPALEYRMYLFDPQKVEVDAIIAPTLNFVPGRGLRYGISFDDEIPQIIDALAHNSQRDWETTVKDSIRYVKSVHTVAGSGYHTLKIWMVDPGVVLEKLVVNLGGMKPSYLGPPESYRAW